VLYKDGLVLLKDTLSRTKILEELDFNATYHLMSNLLESVTDENALISRVSLIIRVIHGIHYMYLLHIIFFH